MLKVGISEVDITPEPGLPMAGMLNPPKAQGAHFPLYSRTFVFDDGANQAAVIALDLLELMPLTVAELRRAVTAGTSIAPEAVFITCSHTHRGPYTVSAMDEDINFDYIDLLRERLVRGMSQAYANRKPARIKVGHIQAPGWTFNRRQVYRTAMGEQVGTQGPEWIPEFIRRESPEDNELIVVQVESPDGVVLGGLVNFSCHPTVMGGEPVYTADFCGPLTEVLAKRCGGVFAFLQGCAGNQWAFDLSRQDSFQIVPAEQATKMGQALADKAVEALKAGHYLENGLVQTASTLLHIPQRRPTREQVDLAQWYLEKRPADIDNREFTRKAYGHEYTFYGSSADDVVETWFARQTLSIWEIQRQRPTREYLEDVEVQIVRIGDLALAGFPGEIFSDFGVKTKAESPFKDTLAVELANGCHGYIPTVEAFPHGGYETRLGYTSRLIPEAGDHMVCTALSLLRKLKA